MMSKYIFIVSFLLAGWCAAHSQQLIVAGRPSQLTIRKAGEKILRITLKPANYPNDFPSSPAVVERKLLATLKVKSTLDGSPHCPTTYPL